MSILDYVVASFSAGGVNHDQTTNEITLSVKAFTRHG